ncbi:MAG TPA: NfeD family protein [Microthrixaceae bacterium]|nr:NfeD family protein [Microthrixaceae bacterium]
MRTLASRRLRLALALGTVGLSLLAAAVAPGAGPAGAQTDCSEHGCVRALEVSGLIDPIMVEFVGDAVEKAAVTPDTVGIVLQLDSPGVVIPDDEFNAFVDLLVDSEVPVSAWVGTGSEARGGAAELLTVLDETSMAPGSAMGDVGSQSLSADRYGELFTGPDAVVLDGVVSAGEARDLGLVDRVAPTIGDHLVELPTVQTETIDQDGEARRQPLTRVVVSNLTLVDELFHTVASPSVTYLLLAIGIGLLIFEFFTAGIGVAGVVGAGAVVLAGYGLGVLPNRGWALGLLIGAAIAFLIDVQAGIPRFWTTIGLGGWIVGSVFLFDGVDQPWIALGVGIVGMAIAMVSGMPAMVRSRFGTPTIGRDWMVGEMGAAVSAVAPDGTVEVQGAMWRARTNRATPIGEGDTVRVVAIDGLTLEVEPEEGGAIDYREMRKARRGGADEPVREQGDLPTT